MVNSSHFPQILSVRQPQRTRAWVFTRIWLFSKNGWVLGQGQWEWMCGRCVLCKLGTCLYYSAESRSDALCHLFPGCFQPCPQACPDGYVSLDTRAGCRACPGGYSCDPHSGLQTSCSPGQYSPEGEQKCRECPQGYICPEGHNRQVQYSARCPRRANFHSAWTRMARTCQWGGHNPERQSQWIGNAAWGLLLSAVSWICWLLHLTFVK